MPVRPSRKKAVKQSAKTSRGSAATSTRQGIARVAPKPPIPSAPVAGMMTSKVTERAQTTLPRGVRDVLGLQPGQRVGYIVESGGVRLVNPSATENEDPIIQGFLALIATHLASDPTESLRRFPQALLDRARALTATVTIDHDAPIDGAIVL